MANKNDAVTIATATTTESVTATMLRACSLGQKEQVLEIIRRHNDDDSNNNNDNHNHNPACRQEHESGTSPLIAAASAGHLEICRILLAHGAPWNAVDRCGKCAGNYASLHGHQDVVDFLVDAAVKAELILGAAQRMMTKSSSASSANAKQEQDSLLPLDQQPCTKPDYLSSHRVRYDPTGTSLLDQDGDAVMMEWERPLMRAHASIISDQQKTGRPPRILNVGFGLGIIDTILQEATTKPALHTIIEAHPTVYENMIRGGCNKKENVRICFGKWQDVIPRLIEEGVLFDGIFFDTYGEHSMDMEDFHEIMVRVLAKPHGVYSFFNGLAPDNIFFHGVACQCVKLQLAKLGIDTEFAPCEIKLDEDTWKGVRRKYWHMDTYYLPICTWNSDYLANAENQGTEHNAKKAKVVVEEKS